MQHILTGLVIKCTPRILVHSQAPINRPLHGFFNFRLGTVSENQGWKESLKISEVAKIESDLHVEN